MDIDKAIALLKKRCEAIDKHYERFPNSLDRTMEETAQAMRSVIAYVEEMDA